MGEGLSLRAWMGEGLSVRASISEDLSLSQGMGLRRDHFSLGLDSGGPSSLGLTMVVLSLDP